MGDVNAVFASVSSAPRVLSVRPSMSPALLEALRDAKALLDDGIFTQVNFSRCARHCRQFLWIRRTDTHTT
jgi:hypothetical protein